MTQGLISLDSWYSVLVIVGLTAVTIITRGLFILPKRSFSLPRRVERALKYAPIAALVAVIAPEILLSTALGAGWIKIISCILAAGYYYSRREMLGTIGVGMGVFLILRYISA